MIGYIIDKLTLKYEKYELTIEKLDDILARLDEVSVVTKYTNIIGVHPIRDEIYYTLRSPLTQMARRVLGRKYWTEIQGRLTVAFDDGFYFEIKVRPEHYNLVGIDYVKYY